jgi:two-component system, NtrC family, sensor histidine kinase AtoS
MAFSTSEEKRMTPEPSGLPLSSRPDAADPGLTRSLQASQHIQREHLLTIFEHVPAGIVSLDLTGRIVAANPAFERAVSRSMESLVGERLAELFPIGGSSLQQHLEEAGRTGGSCCQQNGRFSWSGDPTAAVYWDYTVCATRDPDGTVRGLLLMITDVTDRVLDQQREREETEDGMAGSERLSTLGTLASAIGHELRNPLGVIQNAAHALGQRADDPDRVRRLAETVTTEVQRATRVIADVVDFVRAQPPRRHPVGVSGLVEETLYRVDVPERIAVECDLSPDLPVLRLDGQQMAQVLENLIRNAVEAIPESGSIRLTASRVEDRIELAVADDGPGIPPQDLERIFEPLFTTKRTGTGMSLAISKRLVEAHGGALRVATVPGQGATFTISLPLDVKGDEK